MVYEEKFNLSLLETSLNAFEFIEYAKNCRNLKNSEANFMKFLLFLFRH